MEESGQTREEQIQAITVEDTTQLKKDRKKLKEEIEELDSELSENKRTEKKLKAELEDTITCPKCSHEFIHEYKEIDGEIGKLSDRKELLVGQREEVLANDNTEEELNELSEKITEAEEEVVEIDSNLKKWEKAVKTREEQIQAITVEDTTQLKKDRKKLKEEMEELDSELSENKRTEKKLKAELEDTITCPKCSHEFIHESELELSVEDTKSLLAEAQNEIKNQTKKYEVKETKLKNLNKKIKEAERAG